MHSAGGKEVLKHTYRRYLCRIATCSTKVRHLKLTRLTLHLRLLRLQALIPKINHQNLTLGSRTYTLPHIRYQPYLQHLYRPLQLPDDRKAQAQLLAPHPPAAVIQVHTLLRLRLHTEIRRLPQIHRHLIRCLQRLIRIRFNRKDMIKLCRHLYLPFCSMSARTT